MSESDLTPHEVWKPVPGYEGLYEVSNLGRIKTLRQASRRPADGMLALTRAERRTRYLRTYLTDHTGRMRTFKVHRLVALAFIGPPPDNMRQEVNHKNGDPQHNHADNLEWVSHLENMRHAARMGLRPHKLSAEATPQIDRLLQEGWTLAAISRLLGVSPATVKRHASIHQRVYSHTPSTGPP